jgi:hypothetical protein
MAPWRLLALGGAESGLWPTKRETVPECPLRRSTRIIEQRLRAPVGGREGKLRGYSTRAERWNKQRRLQTLCADGEADKAWGNETIRVHPDENWLEVKLPPDLPHLANRPYGRYRLSCPVVFSYRWSDWRAQVEDGAVRYDIVYFPERDRWYLDASWTYPTRALPTVVEATARGVVAVDLNSGHLACWNVDSDGNPSGSPHSISFASAHPSSSALDGHIRSAISEIIGLARARGCRAVAIENLNFDDLRAGGRERHGRGRRGKQRRRTVAGMPTRRSALGLCRCVPIKACGLWLSIRPTRRDGAESTGSAHCRNELELP